MVNDRRRSGQPLADGVVLWEAFGEDRMVLGEVGVEPVAHETVKGIASDVAARADELLKWGLRA